MGSNDGIPLIDLSLYILGSLSIKYVLLITWGLCTTSNHAPTCISHGACPTSLKIFTRVLVYVHTRYIQSFFFFSRIFETPEDKMSQNLPVLAHNLTSWIRHSSRVLDAWGLINLGFTPSGDQFSSRFYANCSAGWALKDRMV